jgi:hypothetical protein
MMKQKKIDYHTQKETTAEGFVQQKPSQEKLSSFFFLRIIDDQCESAQIESETEKNC